MRFLNTSRLFLLMAAFAVSMSSVGQSYENIDPADLVDAELVPEQTAIQPGVPFTVALRMHMKEGWHTYWLNPGDSGMQTTIDWTLPDEFSASDIIWPHPHKFDESGLTTYAYDGEIFLLTEITPPDDLTPGQTVSFAARADWLVCEKICLPGGADLTLDLPVGSDEPDLHPTWSGPIAEARAEVPQALSNWEVSAAPHGEGYLLRLTPTDGMSAPDPETVTFFASDAATIDHAAPQLISKDGEAFIISLEPSDYAANPAEVLNGVVVADAGWDAGGEVKALAVSAPVEAQFAQAGEADGAASGGLSLGWALLFAFIGGLILNLMPCVFPVLSIKVLGFVQSANEDPAQVRRHGYVFGLGVVLSFLVLAGALLALRAGGEQLGWGFQLQSPGFIALMAFILFALGLSLMGVYEIGTSLMRLGGQSAGTSGYGASFSSGVLATVVATPCTAPFMGSALGFALTQSAVVALLIFMMLGLGMAAPYVLLSMVPSLARRLPRPGPWMETFKQAMAFPLFATVIWLVWVFAQQTGIDGAAYLLLGLLLVGLALWILGRWPAVRLSTTTRFVTRGLALVALVGAAWFTLAATELSPALGVTTAEDDVWEPYSTERVEALRAEGRPVFIDFTAAWCLSCKVNERVALANVEVLDRFEELGIVMLKADWTSRDPEITQALESFGRSGVPLYVLYSGGPDADPTLLPEVLSPGIVLDALDTVATDLAEQRF